MDKKPVNVNVLKAIRNEMIHRERLSTNLMDDCRATKTLLDSTCLSSELHSIKGFIQEINDDPFGLILFTEIEVNNIFLIDA